MIFAAVKATMERCKGGYSVVVLIHNVGVVAFRDPWGIRPLVCGKRASATIDGGIDYVFCSESCAMDTLEFNLIGDVSPGECIVALPMDKGNPRDDKGFVRSQLVGTGEVSTPCIFEYVYFARPDSVMNGVSVYESRLRMGECLARKIQREHPRHDIDCVIPVPDTSRTSALQVSKLLCLPYREGFGKNRYIGRTFIMPGQAMRKKNVRLKLNTIRSEFEGKNVLLVDDSIVRGTTSRQLIEMARARGRKAGILLQRCARNTVRKRLRHRLACAHGADSVRPRRRRDRIRARRRLGTLPRPRRPRVERQELRGAASSIHSKRLRFLASTSLATSTTPTLLPSRKRGLTQQRASA